ncbi:hypothetical protein V8F20_003680 [Naviculisporaceae sp. PSN 640]
MQIVDPAALGQVLLAMIGSQSTGLAGYFSASLLCVLLSPSICSRPQLLGYASMCCRSMPLFPGISGFSCLLVLSLLSFVWAGLFQQSYVIGWPLVFMYLDGHITCLAGLCVLFRVRGQCLNCLIGWLGSGITNIDVWYGLSLSASSSTLSSQ